MKRIKFKKEIYNIIIPTIISFELRNAIDNELKEFYKKFKINKNANLEFRYTGGISYDIIVKK